jgi:hypothetical protein
MLGIMQPLTGKETARSSGEGSRATSISDSLNQSAVPRDEF